MQLLCHSRPTPYTRRVGARARRMAVWLLSVFCLATAAQAQNPAAPDKLLTEVGQWVQKSQQLDASQFSFAPLDSRVQLQSCDRPLVMDTPFASRETVRVRCLGNPGWQLYLRVVLKPGIDANNACVKLLQDHVKATLAPFKSPRQIDFVDKLPRTETGKLQRFRLRTEQQGSNNIRKNSNLLAGQNPKAMPTASWRAAR